jgi:hypothetical protein
MLDFFMTSNLADPAKLFAVCRLIPKVLDGQLTAVSLLRAQHPCSVLRTQTSYLTLSGCRPVRIDSEEERDPQERQPRIDVLRKVAHWQRYL